MIVGDRETFLQWYQCHHWEGAYAPVRNPNGFDWVTEPNEGQIKPKSIGGGRKSVGAEEDKRGQWRINMTEICYINVQQCPCETHYYIKLAHAKKT